MEVRDILNIIKQINPFFVFSKLRAFVVGFPYLSLLCLCSLRATKTANSFYSRKFPLQSRSFLSDIAEKSLA